jgi:5'-nucleotidase / UDP-sugar diphosphatase
MMIRLILIALLALPLGAETTVTLLHISDYHSHALPFYTDQGERGGIARAIRDLASEKRLGALVFSGGDTINKGSPAWSDKYGCIEWPWLNGIVDAMALGNHDADYGRRALEECRRKVRYPILSANTPGFQRYRVLTVGKIRIGVFAVAGSDFQRLGVGRALAPDGKGEVAFGDSVASAREVVRLLREKEHVDAVVSIGHELAEDDYALARAVPGIDLIFGSHSHLRRDLTRIPGTDTWFISPSQYLSYISRVEMTFEGGKLTRVAGRLVPVDQRMPPDRRIAQRVWRLERALERDPKYADLFKPIGRLSERLSVDALAARTLEAMRAATHADVALSTASSFRSPLPDGVLTMELLRAAMPYDNEIVVCRMTGAKLQGVLDANASRSGTDSDAYVSGPQTIDANGTYLVATTDYMAFVAYKDDFDCEKTRTGLKVRDELRRELAR